MAEALNDAGLTAARKHKRVNRTSSEPHFGSTYLEKKKTTVKLGTVDRVPAVKTFPEQLKPKRGRIYFVDPANILTEWRQNKRWKKQNVK